MGHVSTKLSNPLEGALAGGGNPATSPLYVFGPLLKLIVIAGVAPVTFGATLWLVALTVVLVSLMYRLVMRWVTDGSGGSGLSEEELGGWAAKVNAAITFIEYTLTFLVSMAALVTFLADRFPWLNSRVFEVQLRTLLAVALSWLVGWLVNRGPRVAARAFGPATALLLVLLWTLVGATLWRRGLALPGVDLGAFSPKYLHFTLGGYARILALMTGIEIFANLVAAYDGPPEARSRKAFGSLMIIMGTTLVTMLVVGPAILALSDPRHLEVSVFTQTMDRLLPAPLPYVGTLIGVAVLLSAAAASAQGLQNLALGLRHRHYVPAVVGQPNRHGVADVPVYVQLAVVTLCFLTMGTHEETYLALYAAGVFILLSMTGWAACKRLARGFRQAPGLVAALLIGGTGLASLLTTGATVIIFRERFTEGAWLYLVLIPALYLLLTHYRRTLGVPSGIEERLGRLIVERRYLPGTVLAPTPDRETLTRIVVPLDGSQLAEQALYAARTLAHATGSELLLVEVDESDKGPGALSTAPGDYLQSVQSQLARDGQRVTTVRCSGPVGEQICRQVDGPAQLIVMSTHGKSGLERLVGGSVAIGVSEASPVPVLLVRPTDDWRSRRTPLGKVLCCLDGSASDAELVRWTALLAQGLESEVVLLAVPEADETGVLTGPLGEYLERHALTLRGQGRSCRSLVRGSAPVPTIAGVAGEEKVDLIVVGSVGKGAETRRAPDPLGSVPQGLLRQAERPLLIVPIGRRAQVGG